MNNRSLLLRIGQVAVALGIAIYGIVTSEGGWRTFYIVLLVLGLLFTGLIFATLAILPRFVHGQMTRAVRDMPTGQLRRKLLEHAYFRTQGDGRLLCDVPQVRTVLERVRRSRAHEALRKMRREDDDIAKFFADAERVIGVAGAFTPHAAHVTVLFEELARRDTP